MERAPHSRQAARNEINARAQALLDKEPDYGFWLEREHWKLPEAAKLICGCDPMARFSGRPKYNTELRVIDVIDRAFLAVQEGRLKGDRSALLPVHAMVEPIPFLAWAQSENLEIPPRLGLGGQVRAGATALDTSGLACADKASPSEALFERALTVARTLLLVLPTLSLDELVDHPAQTEIAGVTPSQRATLRSYLENNLTSED